MSWKKDLGKSIKELRFIFCQQSSASEGVRQYVKNNYLDLKKKNSDFPILIRECENAHPNVMARYDFGEERRYYLHDMNEKSVEEMVKQLVKDAKQVNQ